MSMSSSKTQRSKKLCGRPEWSARAVSPPACRMTQALMKPAVADFMDSIAAENLDLGFEQLEVMPNSVYAGRKLRFTNIRSELDVVIVAMRHKNGEMIFNPSGDAIIEAGDILIAIGKAEALKELSELARGVKKSG